MSDADQRKTKTKPIVSAILEDGTILEMIHDPSTYRTGLLAFKDGRLEEHRSLDAPRLGRVAPWSPENNLLTHGVVLLPSVAAEYETETDLLEEVRAFIHRYADLSEGFEEVASYYVLLSWCYDAFSEVPYLRFKGDFGSGKSRCLLTIGSLCYKPMFVAGASTVSPMFRIIDAFRGTLVIDESDFRFSDEKAEIVKILNSGNAAGFPVLRSEATPTKEYNPRAFAVFGPKIIATRGDFDDRALESRCITETMSGLPPRPDIPLSLPRSFHQEARELRNKLLMYRFRNVLRNREEPMARESDVEARVAQVYAPLLAVIEDTEARKRVLARARGQSGSIRAERSAGVEAQLLDIIFDMRRDACALSVKGIAERFAERYGADFDRPINARWVGAQLRKRLSLVPVKSHGAFIIPTSGTARLEGLFERYGCGDVPADMGTLGTSPTPPDDVPF